MIGIGLSGVAVPMAYNIRKTIVPLMPACCCCMLAFWHNSHRNLAYVWKSPVTEGMMTSNGLTVIYHTSGLLLLQWSTIISALIANQLKCDKEMHACDMYSTLYCCMILHDYATKTSIESNISSAFCNGLPKWTMV